MSQHNMTDLARNVLRDALALDEKDRAALAGVLLESLDSEQDEGVEEAWAAEIRRRTAELNSGEVETVPWEDVRERLFRKMRGDSSNPIPS